MPRLDGIGDFWLWLPLVASLRKAFPERKIHLLANSLWTNLAAVTGLFDRITPLSPAKLLRSPFYRRQVWQTLQEAPAGLLLNTTFRRRISVEDSLAWFYPATYRIAVLNSPDAMEPNPLRKALDEKLYNKLIDIPFDAHEWTRYEHFTQRAGLPRIESAIYEELYAVFGQKAPHFTQTERFIAVVVGAAAAYRLPSPAYRARLLEQTWAATGLPLVFLGAKAEEQPAETLQKLLSSAPVQSLVGQLSLTEAVACLRGAAGIIGVETGLTHIAATWGKPTLVLMGGGHWGRFFPYPPEFPHQPFLLYQLMPCYGCGWFCHYTLSREKPYPCVAKIAEASMEPFYQWLSAISARKTE